ncbi:thiamine pyrophosphate-binding protein [Gluconacetobacter sacchari]|uniref:Thiamine pyrophosphate-binding protein n=2 Tax=Gluconacetobacter sacchari TaxID=92759 RepID=A0A7W4NQB4_9PROT|nr:thiamine pyrophosphate-binding protein [Gluconacetobacter sacchari]
MPVGDLVAAWLAETGVKVVFGVISIHNMPILDAIARQGRLRFVPARGEAGAMNMADAYARTTCGLGVVITSTGTAAGNAAGSQVEALTACSPVLHITTQIDRPFIDRDRAPIHDVPRQPEMLRGVSKAVLRAWSAASVVTTLAAGASAALSAPSGPVAVEIPIDVQRESAIVPRIWPKPLTSRVQPDDAALDDLAAMLRSARRPVFWFGGGARGAAAQAAELVRRGVAAVTSTNGRATVPEDSPSSLGAFNMTPKAQALYDSADLTVIVGSRLRGNETRNNEMRLGKTVVQIDADASQGARNYPVDLFIHGDAAEILQAILDRIPDALPTDSRLCADVTAARESGEADLRDTLGPYAVIAETLRDVVFQRRLAFVRDVTISNSTFGNRYVRLAAPNLGVHALGGGIGQGIAMAIGAAMSGAAPRTIALVGDGGAMLYVGELTTAVEEKADIVFILMNDRGYGVIRNIQDAQYQGRHHYTLDAIPDFGKLAEAMNLPHRRISDIDAFPAALASALDASGPIMLEIDMIAIGPFARSFAGPPAGAAGKPTT